MGIVSLGNPNEAQLNSIENKIDLLLGNQGTGLEFNLLNLSPTYELNPIGGWSTPPENLTSIYDADESSASNLFTPPPGAWQFGELIMNANISTPQYTRLIAKIGIRNTADNEAVWFLSVFNAAKNDYLNIWAYMGFAPSNADLIANIDVIIPFSWTKLKLKLQDIGKFQPQARFYDLKVWEVS